MTLDLPSESRYQPPPTDSRDRSITTRDLMEGDGRIHNSLAFALRGSIATLTARVADLHRAVQELQIKADKSREKPECSDKEFVGDQFRSQLLPVIQETMTSVVNQLKDIKQQLPETIGTQLQTSLVTVKQDLQRLSSDNKQGQSLGDGLKNLQPMMTHLLTLLTPISQIPTTFTNFQQSVYSCLDKQSQSITRQDKTAGQLQQDAKRIIDATGQIISADDRNSAQVVRAIGQATNVQTVEIVREIENRFSTILDEKLGEIESRLKEHVDIKFADLDRTLIEALQAKAIHDDAQHPPAPTHINTDEPLIRAVSQDDPAENQIGPNAMTTLKRQLSVSSITASEPDCDQDPVHIESEGSAGGLLHKPDVQENSSAGFKIPSQDETYKSGSLDAVGGKAKETPTSWSSNRDRRKRRRMTVSPELSDLPLPDV